MILIISILIFIIIILLFERGSIKDSVTDDIYKLISTDEIILETDGDILFKGKMNKGKWIISVDLLNMNDRDLKRIWLNEDFTKDWAGQPVTIIFLPPNN